MTTLFARLVLSDLFIHGIGGAKYDQLTDELIRGFFGLTPPDYLVISATLHLATSADAVPLGEVRHLDQELRDLEYHPEQCIAGLHDWTTAPVDIAHWLALKSRWLATEQTRETAATLSRHPRGERGVTGVGRAAAARIDAPPARSAARTAFGGGADVARIWILSLPRGQFAGFFAGISRDNSLSYCQDGSKV